MFTHSRSDFTQHPDYIVLLFLQMVINDMKWFVEKKEEIPLPICRFDSLPFDQNLTKAHCVFFSSRK